MLLMSCGGPETPSAGEKNLVNRNGIYDGTTDEGQPSDALSQSPTNTYRLLTAVRNNGFETNAELAAACKRYLGFNDVIINARVISAREIEVPIQMQEEVTRMVPRTKPRTVTVRPESDNGIIYEPETKVIYENDGYEEKRFKKYHNGFCMGTEYITE